MFNKTQLILILISLFLLFLSTSEEEYKCLDPYGKQVDWYVLFFFPKNISPDNEIHYGYLDSTSSGIRYFKYQEIYFPPTRITKYALDTSVSDYNYFFWNDDTKTKDSYESTFEILDDEGEEEENPQEKAHSKGSLIFNKNSGVFLPHSLPRFPTRTKENEVLTELPSNAGFYGQNFLCISINYNTSIKITELLNIIDVSNNKGVQNDRVNPTQPNPWVEKLIRNVYDPSYPPTKVTKIHSVGGMEFTVFSKGARHNQIPYEDTLRQHYSDNFDVLTWTKPKLSPSVCENYKLLNVIYMKFNDKFRYGNDKEHSKWAVAENKDIVCFGDLNHVYSQAKRGGNIVCFNDSLVAKTIRGFIMKKEECP